MTWDVLVLYIGFASAFCHDIEVEMDMIWKQLVCSIYLEGFIMGNKEKKKRPSVGSQITPCSITRILRPLSTRTYLLVDKTLDPPCLVVVCLDGL